MNREKHSESCPDQAAAEEIPSRTILRFLLKQLTHIEEELDRLSAVLPSASFERGTDQPLNTPAAVVSLAAYSRREEIGPAIKSARQMLRLVENDLSAHQ